VTTIVVHVVVLFILLFFSPPAPALAQRLEAPTGPRNATPVSPQPISNICVDDPLEPLVSTLLAKSPTFRRQWAVISASRLVRVTVRSRPGMEDFGSTRAKTQVSRSAHGAIRATIEVPGATDLTELLPHEFEHVIEQLDGLDLPALAQRHEGGVVEVRRGVFETARARAAGLQVHREVYAGIDPAVEAALGGVRRAWRAMWGGRGPQTGAKTQGPGANRRPGSPIGPAPHLHKRW
jgi:hypothetical protein